MASCYLRRAERPVDTLPNFWCPLRTLFFSPDLELGQLVRAETVQERYVRRISPARQANAPDTRNIVARVERIPFAAEIGLEPGVEVHWRRIGRDADIAQIPVHIASWNVHAATKRDCKMRKVAANAHSFLMSLS